MSDLLRLARAARTFGGLVGLSRFGAFRNFAVGLACVTVGLALFKPGPVALIAAVAVWFTVRAVRARGFSSWGTHRARHSD